MHSNGVVHRDMNPTNVFISDDEKTIKILDFNVSKLFDKPIGNEYDDSKSRNQDEELKTEV